MLDVGGGAFVTTAIEAGVQFTAWTVVEPHEADLPSVTDPRVRTPWSATAVHSSSTDNSFDTVLSIQVLEHVFEPIRMFEELHRVTRPGAAIIVMVPQTANLHHVPHHYQNLTRYWLEEAAQRLGAEVVEYHALGGAWSTIASRLLLQYPAAFGVDGYAHPGVTSRLEVLGVVPAGCGRERRSTFPLVDAAVTRRLKEEANNHVIVLRKRSRGAHERPLDQIFAVRVDCCLKVPIRPDVVVATTRRWQESGMQRRTMIVAAVSVCSVASSGFVAVAVLKNGDASDAVVAKRSGDGDPAVVIERVFEDTIVVLTGPPSTKPSTQRPTAARTSAPVTLDAATVGSSPTT